MNYGRCAELAEKLEPLTPEDSDLVCPGCCGSCHDEMENGYQGCEFELVGETFADVCCTVAVFAGEVVPT